MRSWCSLRRDHFVVPVTTTIAISAFKVLLIADSLICREQQIDGRSFRRLQKITVVQFIPALPWR
jgi:hypothetical protein